MWQRLFPGPRTSGPSQPPCYRRSATASLRLGLRRSPEIVPAEAGRGFSPRPHHVRRLHRHFVHSRSYDCPVEAEGATESDCLLLCGRLPPFTPISATESPNLQLAASRLLLYTGSTPRMPPRFSCLMRQGKHVRMGGRTRRDESASRERTVRQDVLDAGRLVVGWCIVRQRSTITGKKERHATQVQEHRHITFSCRRRWRGSCDRWSRRRAAP